MASLTTEDNWKWNYLDCSDGVRLDDPDSRVASFHANLNHDLVGVRGTRVLNNGRYYWELQVTSSSVVARTLFGIATKKMPLDLVYFPETMPNKGWFLTHVGLLWHSGEFSNYKGRFLHHFETPIGVLFDGISGTLSYYINGKYVGVAFNRLNEVKDALYPFVALSSDNAAITLTKMTKEFVNLQGRCRAVILKRVKVKARIEELPLPKPIKDYLKEPLDDVQISVN
jgi:SOCS box./SPRY domain.